MFGLVVTLALGIIGGAPSDDDAVVCLSADTLPVCSGVLIGKRTVLTAGHCINTLGTGVTYFVNFGADCTRPRLRRKVEEQRAHPSFTAAGAPFDLGLLRLGVDADVAPLELSDAQVEVGGIIRHVGFGASQEQPLGGRGTRLAVSHAVLRVDADFLWSGDATANTCLGDSGGPALLDERVLAVVSDGPDCHSESADQRVDRGREWVDTTLATFEPVATPPPRTGCSTAPIVFASLLLFLLRRR